MKSSSRVVVPLFLILPLLLLLLALPLGAQTLITATVDRGTGAIRNTSQAIVNGTPAIAYYNLLDGHLMFARNSAPDGSGTWIITTVDDSNGGSGGFISLAVVNKIPAISYSDDAGLKYVRASDASGVNWGTPVVVDLNIARFTSLAVANGNPAISYYDYGHAFLKYVRASDASGTNWGTPVTVDSTGNGGAFTSLAVVNGNPAISHGDIGTNDLKYVRALNANGTSWGNPVTVDPGGSAGYTSLKVVNGNPAISYNGKYVRAGDPSGANWGMPVTVDPGGSDYTSLKVVNGNPAISYGDNGHLKYVRAGDLSGINWGAPVIVDNTPGNVAQYTSLVVVNGNPAISYYTQTNASVKYVRASDPSGANWGMPVTVDNGTGDVGQYTSLKVVNGNPAISYMDIFNPGLKYVRAANPSGTKWRTPVTVAGRSCDNWLEGHARECPRADGKNSERGRKESGLFAACPWFLREHQ